MAGQLEFDAVWTRPTHPRRGLYFACKWALDTLIAGVGLVLLSPLMLAIAALVRLDSPGLAIFKQERVGAKRRVEGGLEWWELGTFTMYKFRTMYADADTRLHREYVRALIHDDQGKMTELQGQETEVRKLVNDPRVTRVGRYLRRTSLDELPQLWNVVKGEMSLVGPRPPLPYEVQEYRPWHRRRLAALPGCTGLWQVSARDTVGFERMIELDAWYIDHQSLWLDLKILLRTPFVAFLGKGGL